MGFVGRTAIHPSQVPVIAAAFAPTDAEIAWANEVLAATAAGGVTTLASGEMVDPAMRAARCVDSRARRRHSGTQPPELGDLLIGALRRQRHHNDQHCGSHIVGGIHAG